MRNTYGSLILGALTAALAACGSSTSNPNSSPGATGGTGSGGGGTSGAGGQSGATTCIQGVPATSQVPRMKTAYYDAVVKELLGVSTLASAANAAPSSLLVPDYDGSMTKIAWDGYLSAADKVAAEVIAGESKSRFINCDATMGTCLTDTIKAFGRKAFRRPLTDEEVARFAKLGAITPAGTADEIAEAVLYAFLASPSFILLPELAQEKEGTAIKLSSYEVATRLSFLLWGSVPDDPLNAAADANQLQTREQIGAQAARMLESTRAASVVSSLHRFYAGISSGSHWVNGTQHDATKFPKYTAGTYPSMMGELDAFFQEVMLKKGTFKDLFLSRAAFVNKDTAAIYGLDASQFGAELTRVELDPNQRPGFLTRLAFLSTFSESAATSPILRGAFISGRILDISPGNPDPKALKEPIPPGTYLTRREQIEALTGKSPCSSCHGPFINPAGFVLERYDAVGSWQDTDALGGAIDGTADVLLAPGVTKTISSPLELMTELAALPNVQRLYAQQLVAFAAGRVANANDACVVDDLSRLLGQDGYPLVGLVAEYTKADSFRLRTMGN